MWTSVALLPRNTESYREHQTFVSWRPITTSQFPSEAPATKALRCQNLITRISVKQVVTRSSADADKPAQRVLWSVKVTKNSTIPYVRYSFLLCNSNFVFKTRRFYNIRLQKCCDLEMGSKVTQGH